MENTWTKNAWAKVETRTFFKCLIHGLHCVGRVQQEQGNTYLCQNEQDGSEPHDKLGYSRGWYIGHNPCEITNIGLSVEPFEGMVVPEIGVEIKLNKSYHAIITSKKVVCDSSEFTYEEILKLKSEIQNISKFLTEVSNKTTSKIYPITEWDKVKTGDWFTAVINGYFCTGQIQKEGGLNLCQNKIHGSKADDSLGYKYGWSIGGGSKNDLECLNVMYLTLYESKPTIKLDTPDIIENDMREFGNRYYSVENLNEIHIGCQKFTFEILDKVIALMDKRKKDLVK